MTFYRNLITFSPNAEYFAYSNPDGCLKIWETSTGILKQEYTPSSHLSATCTSLSWRPVSLRTNTQHSPKNTKKIRQSTKKSSSNLELIAMGLLTGDIMLYNFIDAELHTYFKDGHTAVVNDVCWCIVSNSVFTCSNDQHIILWDLTSGKIKIKWKADKVPIHSLCAIDEENLLSASTSILWWDVKSKTVIKSFSGHATEIYRLLFISARNQADGTYFLSSAVGDRVISAWNLNNPKRNIASFVSVGEPTVTDLYLQDDEILEMCTVTKDGLFHLFEHNLNDKLKRPKQPKLTVQVASTPSAPTSKPRQIPILAANISGGLDSCLLVYGTSLNPVFERINLLEHSNDLYLIRNAVPSSISLQDSVSKIKQPEKPSRRNMLIPGCMTDTSVAMNKSKKRKQKRMETTELPMEECLKALNLDHGPENVKDKEPPMKVDSVAHLLLQGLQSKDNDMLNCVLQNANESVIRQTLERIPLAAILSTLKEIHVRLQKKETRNQAALKWLKALLSIHLPYLMSCKDVDEYLLPFCHLIEARVENFCKLSQLKGCLNVLLLQENSCIQADDCFSQPLVDYRSESSDGTDEEITTEREEQEEQEKMVSTEESESEEEASENVLL